MVPLDVTEAQRWLATADQHLRAGRHLRDGGFHAHAVLSAEQAAQCAVNAVLRGTGSADRARGHSLPELLAASAERSGFAVEEALRVRLAELAAHYQPTRYPDALASGTPDEHYGSEAAERFLQIAEDVVGAAAAHIERLRAAAAEDEEEGEQGDDPDAG